MAKLEKNGQYGQDNGQYERELNKQGQAKQAGAKPGQAEKQGKPGKHNGFGKTSREEEVGKEEAREASKSSKY